MGPDRDSDLVEMARSYAKHLSPNDRAVRLVIVLSSGEHIRLPVPEEPAVTLSDGEQEILEALGDDTLSGKQLAAKMGRTNSGRFKETLANMVRKELLRRLPEGYQAAV